MASAIKCCPYCKSDNFIKYGKAHDIQRYKCKNMSCYKTFSENHFSIFKNSRKFHKMRDKYFELMIGEFTIRQCAKILNITEVTAFFWRHKILNYFKEGNVVESLEEYVEVTKLIHIENLKGDRNIKTDKRDKIIIVSAVDKYISILSKPICKYRCNLSDVREKIYSKISKSSYSVGYFDQNLMNASKIHNKKLKKAEEQPIDPHYSLKIKRWLRKFCGVASKYIDHYLNWHIFNYRCDDKKYMEALNGISSYIEWRNIKNRRLAI